MRNSKYDFSSVLKKKKQKTVGLTCIHILSTSTRSYQIFGCFTQSGKKSYSIYWKINQIILVWIMVFESWVRKVKINCWLIKVFFFLLIITEIQFLVFFSGIFFLLHFLGIRKAIPLFPFPQLMGIFFPQTP